MNISELDTHADVTRLYRYERGTVAITILERISTRSALISWSDARFGRLGAQVWTAGRARAAGACALSGRMIRRGDAVYTPRKTQPAPINLGAMIIASYVNEAPMASSKACA
jgi:hypothetical protein